MTSQNENVVVLPPEKENNDISSNNNNNNNKVDQNSSNDKNSNNNNNSPEKIDDINNNNVICAALNSTIRGSFSEETKIIGEKVKNDQLQQDDLSCKKLENNKNKINNNNNNNGKNESIDSSSFYIEKNTGKEDGRINSKSSANNSSSDQIFDDKNSNKELEKSGTTATSTISNSASENSQSAHRDQHSNFEDLKRQALPQENGDHSSDEKIDKEFHVRLAPEKVDNKRRNENGFKRSSDIINNEGEMLEVMDKINKFVKSAQFTPTMASQIFKLHEYLTKNGEKLENTHKNDLNQVFVSIRQACCRDSGQLGMPCRLKMMELIELRAMKWRPNLSHSQYYLNKSNSLSGVTGGSPPAASDASSGGGVAAAPHSPTSLTDSFVSTSSAPEARRYTLDNIHAKTNFGMHKYIQQQHQQHFNEKLKMGSPFPMPSISPQSNYSPLNPASPAYSPFNVANFGGGPGQAALQHHRGSLPDMFSGLGPHSLSPGQQPHHQAGSYYLIPAGHPHPHHVGGASAYFQSGGAGAGLLPTPPHGHGPPTTAAAAAAAAAMGAAMMGNSPTQPPAPPLIHHPIAPNFAIPAGMNPLTAAAVAAALGAAAAGGDFAKGAVTKSANKATKIPGKGQYRDEVIIRNADSGKIMGVKGRRVSIIEELSGSIISFQKVAQEAKERTLTITGPNEESLLHAKILIEDTIRRNVSPTRKNGDSDSPTSRRDSMLHAADDDDPSASAIVADSSLSVADVCAKLSCSSPTKFSDGGGSGASDGASAAAAESRKNSFVGGSSDEIECALTEMGSVLKLSCADPTVLRAARQALNEYFHRRGGDPNLRRSSMGDVLRSCSAASIYSSRERRKSMPLPLNVLEEALEGQTESGCQTPRQSIDIAPENMPDFSANVFKFSNSRSTPSLISPLEKRHSLKSTTSLNENSSENRTRIVYTRDYLLQFCNEVTAPEHVARMGTEIKEKLGEVFLINPRKFDAQAHKKKFAILKQYVRF